MTSAGGAALPGHIGGELVHLLDHKWNAPKMMQFAHVFLERISTGKGKP